MPKRNDARRVALLHGPYACPAVRVGERVSDPRYGEAQTVGGLTDCPVGLWPVLRRKGHGRIHWLGADLARAVELESAAAVAHWWGVDVNTVTRWRKAMGVVETNGGTAELRRDRTPTNVLRRDSVERLMRVRRTPRHRALRSEAGKRRCHGEGGPPGKVCPEKFRAAVAASGLSQAEVARRAGVSPTRVGHFATGKHSTPTRATLDALTSVLGVRSADLLA